MGRPASTETELIHGNHSAAGIVVTRIAAAFLWCVLAGVSLVGAGLSAGYLYLNPQVPPVASLTDVRIKAPMRIYSNDGKLIQEFGERLIPVTYDEIPPLFVQALLNTEDKRFFEHSGVDPITLINATWQLVRNRGAISGGGASTITMQLVKNISGSKEQLFIRKFKEILLAIKLERELAKEEILSLYLNVVGFGKHAYGVQAAARTYYGRNVDELTVAETAMLAGVIKRPEARNPINGPRAAVKRRNLVLRRMFEQGTIDQPGYDEAVAAPITARVHSRPIELPALYLAEMVRRHVLDEFGADAYSQGLTVTTTVDSGRQALAERALHQSLLAYDKRHGWRGPVYRELSGTFEYLSAPEHGYPTNWVRTLANAARPGGLMPGIVMALDEEGIDVLIQPDPASNAEDAERVVVRIGLDTMRWAREFRDADRRGVAPTSPEDVVSLGDLILLEPRADGWGLSQAPTIQGALVSLDPRNGAIRALSGGFDFRAQQYNHATQARRQPGSSFKPFFYAGALERGDLTASSIFNDRPVVLPGGGLEEVYRPKNSGETFRGNIRLREALTRSINLVSLRVVLNFGPDNVIDFVRGFGFDTSTFPRDVQLAFGGGTIALTPLEVATGYAAFANGGFRVEPHFIESVRTLEGDLDLVAKPAVACRDCDPPGPGESPHAPAVMSDEVAYIMDSVLADVVRRGTGRNAYTALKREDLRGKTGTTNDADTWFTGYNADLVTSVWVGFDDNSPVGKREWGSTTPLEAWTAYMQGALPEDESYVWETLPAGLVRVRINRETGLATTADDPDAVFEVFRAERAPKVSAVAARRQDSEAAEAVQQIF